MFRFYYDRSKTGDSLFLYGTKFDFLNAGISEFVSENGKYFVEFKDISKIFKVKAAGMIIALPDDVTDILNRILEKENMGGQIPYCKKSGFVSGTIIAYKNGSYEVDLGNKVVTIESKTSDLLGKVVLVALPGSFLSDKNCVNEFHICTGDDIFGNQDKAIVNIENSINNGIDYFMGR